MLSAAHLREITASRLNVELAAAVPASMFDTIQAVLDGFDDELLIKVPLDAPKPDCSGAMKRLRATTVEYARRTSLLMALETDPVALEALRARLVPLMKLREERAERTTRRSSTRSAAAKPKVAPTASSYDNDSSE